MYSLFRKRIFNYVDGSFWNVRKESFGLTPSTWSQVSFFLFFYFFFTINILLINWPFYGELVWKLKLLPSLALKCLFPLASCFISVCKEERLDIPWLFAKYSDPLSIFNNAVQEMHCLSTSDTAWIFMSQNSCITNVCAYNNFVCGISCGICFKNVAVQVIWVSK